MTDNSQPVVRWQGKFLRVLQHGRWEYVDRVGTSGAVAIVATTTGGEAVLTEQYRLPMQKRVLELPAGLAGDAPEFTAESLEAAARRELLEETGYAAEELVFLASGPPSAGLATETVAFFHAKSARKVAPGGGDAHEAIQVHVVPLDELDSWLQRRTAEGVMVDPKIFAGLYLIRACASKRALPNTVRS